MGWVVNATSRPLYPHRKRPVSLCTGGWVGLRACLDRCGKSLPHWDSISGPTSPQLVAIPTELSRLHHIIFICSCLATYVSISLVSCEELSNAESSALSPSALRQAGRTLRRRQHSPRRAEQSRFLLSTRLNVSAQVER
jgi:hypothetical protein